MSAFTDRFRNHTGTGPMTPTLQDLIDSAKLCGYECNVDEHRAEPRVYLRSPPRVLSEVRWNPSEDGNQDREIRDALLAKGWSVHFDGIHVKPQGYIASMTKEKRFFCDANDFLTLAGAHVWRIENE